jgi:hypothetical protein
MVYELKYKDDIIDALDTCDKLKDIWIMLEHMQVKYTEIDDPVSICLNMAKRNLILARDCIIDAIPEESLKNHFK